MYVFKHELYFIRSIFLNSNFCPCSFTRTGSLPITLDVSVWVLAGRNGAKALVGVSLSVTAAHRVKDLNAGCCTSFTRR